jgi:hypothetical protein
VVHDVQRPPDYRSRKAMKSDGIDRLARWNYDNSSTSWR